MRRCRAGRVGVVAGAGLAVASACALPRLGDRPPSTGNAEADQRFEQAHQHWTRERPVYSLLDTRVFLAVTQESWEFRQARVERLGLFRLETRAEKDKALAEEKADHEKFLRFTVGVHANERRFDDFDRKDSIWRVAALTAQGESLPARWERISRPDANMKAVYPYLGEFWVAYRVWFARPGAAATPVTVRFASSVGRADFEFPAE